MAYRHAIYYHFFNADKQEGDTGHDIFPVLFLPSPVQV
jgi:hypothetical protein